MLHCIENEVNGGLSTLVDGLLLQKNLKKNFLDYYKILLKLKLDFNS